MLPRVLLAAALPLIAVPAGAELKTYQTKYYVLHTDLEQDGVRELISRLTVMADEYHERTRGFAGTVRVRLPVRGTNDPSSGYDAQVARLWSGRILRRRSS